MKIVKKFLAIALCLTMLLGIIPFGMVGASAITQDEVTKILDSIIADYSIKKGGYGKYFNNHPDRPCYHSNKEYCWNEDDGVNKNGSCRLKEILEYKKISTKNYYVYCGTCLAFASYCFTKCFGKPYDYNNKYSTSFTTLGYVKGSDSAKVKEFFTQKASVGDIIQLDFAHWGVVYKIESDGVYVLENNVGGDATKTGPTALFKRKYDSTYFSPHTKVYLDHANNYSAIKQTVADPAIAKNEPTDNGVKVYLKSATAGATIYYTLDGKTSPTTNSTKYSDSSPIILTGAKKTVIKAIAVKSGMNNSAVKSLTVSVSQTASPKINSSVSGYGFNITIEPPVGAKVFYTTDGTTPNPKAAKEYTGSFLESEASQIKAIAVKNGEAYSDPASISLSANAPAAPQLTLKSFDTIGIDDTVRLSWNSVEGAASYKLIVSGTESEEVNLGNVTAASYIVDKAGTYLFTIKAVNFKGESPASSPAAKVIVKPDVTVTFKVNGKTYTTQKIRYGASAAEPAKPTLNGCDFNGWDMSFKNVTSDITVNAKFITTIKFLNEDGSEIKTQSVELGKSADVPSSPAKSGYKFSGWTLAKGPGTSYTKVDGNAEFKPVFVEESSNLPLSVTIDSAIRSDDSMSYAVSIKVTNSQSKNYDAKVITTIKTANDKIVASDIQAISIPANANGKAFNITVDSIESAMLCEVFIVSGDADNAELIGGALSAKASKAVTKNASSTIYFWSDWSEWTESSNPPASTQTKDVETKIQYAYTDKETTSAKTATLDGWTQTGKSVSYGNWSAWDDVVLTPNATTEVQKAVIYRYYYYECASCGNRQPYWNCACTKCGRTVDNSHRGYMCSDISYSKVASAKYDNAKRVTTQFDNGKKWFFSSGNINDTKVGTIDAAGSAQVIFNGYRKRTINTTYSFERWTEWSAWSDSPYTAIENSREVKTRTVYHYRTLNESVSTGSSDYIVTENTSGTKHVFSGNISNLNKDYKGQRADVIVYRQNMTDIQYVGEITLGADNSYSISFIPKNEISESAEDYTVALGISTVDKLINVGTVESQKQKYKVEFLDLNGDLISTQNVESGKDATPPTLPVEEGYIVTWSRSYTNISENTIIRAQKTARTYTVVFVDWANSDILSIQENVEYGSVPKYPSNPTAEGKIFKGWSLAPGSKITETTVIEAVYDDITFTVDYLNKDGSIYESMTVPYGGFASIPESNPTAEGFEFVAWDSNTAWWNVKSDVSVKPIFIYDSTVEAPIATESEQNFGAGSLAFETNTEEAVIYFTTDGSEPTEGDAIYSGTVVVEETTRFKAKAFKDGMNPSSTTEIVVEVVPSGDIPSVAVSTDKNYYKVNETSATIFMVINNPSGYPIKEYGYSITDLDTDEAKVGTGSKLVGSTEKAVGPTFTISNLTPGTEYMYFFYVIFDVDGEDLVLSTAPNHTDADVTSFITLGEKPVNPGDDDPDEPVVPTGYSVKIKTPSTTTVKYGYTLVLHAEVEGTLPEGAKVVWKETSGEAFKATASGLTAKATSTVKGEKTITVCIVDADGNVLKNENGEDIQDSVTLTAKVSFFTKLAYFFKHLFGANLTIDA